MVKSHRRPDGGAYDSSIPPVVSATATTNRAMSQFAHSTVVLSRIHAQLVLEAGRLFLVPLGRDEALVNIDDVGTQKDQRVELRDGASLNFVSRGSTPRGRRGIGA